jgi:hypothetical protein
MPWRHKLLFPNTGFNIDATMESLINAIELHGIDTLAAMMCKNIKQNSADLQNTIATFLSSIPDEITALSWDGSSVEEDYIDHGKRIRMICPTVNVQTSKAEYRIHFSYEEEKGIRAMVLFAAVDETQELYAKQKPIYKISATEDASGWEKDIDPLGEEEKFE